MIRSDSFIESRMRTLEQRLRRRGLSVTHQRLAVYRALLETTVHPDAERLFAQVRRRVPTISLGTVYKALDTLKDLGAITEVDAPRSATRYEALLEPHHHLICEQCGAIIDLHEPRYSRLRLPGHTAPGFQVESCTVQFRGRCKRCAARRTKGGKDARLSPKVAGLKPPGRRPARTRSAGATGIQGGSRNGQADR